MKKLFNRKIFKTIFTSCFHKFSFLFIIILIHLSYVNSFCSAACPVRLYSYIPGTTIRSAEVTANEDALFNACQSGWDNIKDGTIVNADINGSAGIDASKLDLSTISQNITHSGTFTQTNSASFTTITNLGNVSDGTLNGVDIGTVTPGIGTFSILGANTGTISFLDLTTPLSLADGGTGQSLVDPNADKILFWDDGEGKVDWLASDNISGTTLTAGGWEYVEGGALSAGTNFTITETLADGYVYNLIVDGSTNADGSLTISAVGGASFDISIRKGIWGDGSNATEEIASQSGAVAYVLGYTSKDGTDHLLDIKLSYKNSNTKGSWIYHNSDQDENSIIHTSGSIIMTGQLTSITFAGYGSNTFTGRYYLYRTKQ